MFSKHHPTCNDGRGNINNIIDTSNYPLPNLPKKDNYNNNYPNYNHDLKSSHKNGGDFQHHSNNNDNNNTKSFLTSKNEKCEKSVTKIKKAFHINSESYHSYIPSKKELHLDATSCPENYKEKFNLHKHSNQDALGKLDFLNYLNDLNITANNSFLAINSPPHVNLNHFSLNASKNPLKSQVIVTNCIQRSREKFTTFIYYKPAN